MIPKTWGGSEAIIKGEIAAIINLMLPDINTEDGPKYHSEFTLEGITCTNCTNSIERALTKKFRDRGLLSANCLLLTHKLTVIASSEIPVD